MSDEIAKLLSDLTFESGAVAPEGSPEEALADVAVGELGNAGGETIASVADQMETTGIVATQFEDIAGRAEVLETQAEDAEKDNNYAEERIVDVSAEALAREFNTVLVSNRLGGVWAAPSLESKDKSSKRLAEIKATASGYANVSRQANEKLGDVSNEAGSLERFLDAHVKRLRSSRETLHTQLAKLSNAAPELKNHPKEVPHNKAAGFLTREHAQVTDLPAAIKAESTWMKKASEAITHALGELSRSAESLNGTHDVDISKLIPHSITDKLKACATKPGELMGNYSVSIKDTSNPVPSFKRSNEKHYTGGATAGAAAVGVVGGAAIGYSLANASTMLLFIGGATLGPVVAGAAIASYAAGATIGKRLYHHAKDQIHDRTKAVSIATAEGLKKAIGEVLDYQKYTDTKLDHGTVLDKLDAIVKANPERKKAAAIITQAVWHLAVLNEILYDQAVYTTLNMAAVTNRVS